MGGFEEHAEKMDIKSIVITMILSSLGFLLALAYRDAIQQTIDLFVPKGEGLFYTWLAAIVITFIAVAITFVVIRLQKMDIIPDKYEEKIKRKVRKKKQAPVV